MHLWFWRIEVGACQYLWDCLLNPWVWIHTRRPGIPSCHVAPHLGSGGGQHWRIPPPPVTSRISSALPRVELNYFSWSEVTGFRIPSPYFLTAIVLRDPMTGGGSPFQRKHEEKRFRKSYSPLQRTSLLCFRWRVEEIPILIGFHVPLWSNSNGNISPWFCWSCWYSYLMSAYSISTNHVWTRRHQCNPQDNVRSWTP